MSQKALFLLGQLLLALLAHAQSDPDRTIKPNEFTAPLNRGIMYKNTSYTVTWTPSTPNTVELGLILYDENWTDTAGDWQLVRSMPNTGKWVWETVGLVNQGRVMVSESDRYMITMRTTDKDNKPVYSESGNFEILPFEDAPDGGNSASPPNQSDGGDSSGTGDDEPTDNQGGDGATPGSVDQQTGSPGFSTSTATPEGNSSGDKSGISTGAIVGIVVGVVALIGLGIGAFIIMKRRNARTVGPSPEEGYEGKPELEGRATVKQSVSDEKVVYVAAAPTSEGSTSGSNRHVEHTTDGTGGMHEVHADSLRHEVPAPMTVVTDGGMHEVEGTNPTATAGLTKVDVQVIDPQNTRDIRSKVLQGQEDFYGQP